MDKRDYEGDANLISDRERNSGSSKTLTVDAVNANGKGLYRMGGISAVVLGASYLIIIALYGLAGAPPTGGEAWLKYLSGNTTVWWAIVGLSVMTDFLFVPVALSLYLALKEVNRNIMLVATGFVGLFVVLDLAVTWPNYSSLIILSGNYAASTTEVQRAGYVATANYASVVLTSPLLPVYSILVLSIGILIIGLVMLKGIFSKSTAYLGCATGVLGIASVAGPLFTSALDATVIIASALTLVWCLLTGYGLYRLGQP